MLDGGDIFRVMIDVPRYRGCRRITAEGESDDHTFFPTSTECESIWEQPTNAKKRKKVRKL
jgi:hypothetical protein